MAKRVAQNGTLSPVPAHRSSFAGRFFPGSPPVRFIALSLLITACSAAHADLLPPMTGNSADFAVRRSGSAVDARIRIELSGEGLYRVDYETLHAAGIPDEHLVGSRLRLFRLSSERAIYVSTQGRFGAGDHFMFYAEPFSSLYTLTNVFWLGFGDGGRRMSLFNAAPSGACPDVTNHTDHAVFEAHRLYAPTYEPDNASLDHWFCSFMDKAGGVSNSFAIPTEDRAAGLAAVATLNLHGNYDYPGVDPDHRTELRINGTVAGTNSFDGFDTAVGVLPFPSSILSNGFNTITLQQRFTGAIDRAYLSSFVLDYTRDLSVRSDYLAFRGIPGSNNYVVSGISTAAPPPWVLDISDPVSPSILTDSSVTSLDGHWSARFCRYSAGTGVYCVVAEPAVRMPASVRRIWFRNLADESRQADYIMICPYRLRSQCYRILKHRSLSGLTAAVAPLTDIYNEFCYGIEDPAAIKQFLGYAFHHWADPDPRYVLLVGDSTYDPTGNLGPPTDNICPAHLGPSAWNWTAMDNWYALVNGQNDQLADMAVGRIPVHSDAEMEAVVDKIVAFEGAVRSRGAWTTNATLVADKIDINQGVTNNFKRSSETNLASNLKQAAFIRGTIYLDDPPYSGSDPTNATVAIRQRFNAGSLLFTYFGHGAVTNWSNYFIWDGSDVLALTNAVYPVMAMFTCDTGYFIDPPRTSLAEGHLLKARGGTVACFAPTVFADNSYSEYMADGFCRRLVQTNGTRLGEATWAGISNLWQKNSFVSELTAYTLFGDPATLIRE